jgi:hypothetical protein
MFARGSRPVLNPLTNAAAATAAGEFHILVGRSDGAAFHAAVATAA